MKIYRVGGSVRDELLGLPVQDCDYVVVGATPDQMVAQGFKPVGADFPVFLHPDTHAEYALARTERKAGRGYKGFTVHAAPDVTLEEDLARRDLTINAMAIDASGTLIDPYGGRRDLQARVLRHVGPAFAEDPVRILRVARFAARLAQRGFAVAAETMALMRTMVASGEVDHLVAERVWQEISRGLMEPSPAALFGVLRDCGALPRIAPAWPDTPAALDALTRAAQAQASLAVRFATAMTFAPPDSVESLCTRLRVPADCRDLALLAARYAHPLIDLPAGAMAAAELLERTDALRRPERFEDLLHTASLALDSAPAFDWTRALAALQSLDFGALARQSNGHPAEAIRAAKISAIEQFMKGNTP
ncbi:MAG: multifunctional CCA tRNA nucleotidyl transferase/2'3'-cyclic phosphodiesterase/2'nucleotidase/phosphatase [Betaproteobacteria bacterium]|nr:multifunctional CCA tRNA nucleotidyl transferase/2'3'-cyclic phosphodiesterase/2'nucleotidase/phosphatase [Betaproteobacteria bacterium]